MHESTLRLQVPINQRNALIIPIEVWHDGSCPVNGKQDAASGGGVFLTGNDPHSAAVSQVAFIAFTISNFPEVLNRCQYLSFGIETRGHSPPTFRPDVFAALASCFRIIFCMKSQTPRSYVFSKNETLLPWEVIRREFRSALRYRVQVPVI